MEGKKHGGGRGWSCDVHLRARQIYKGISPGRRSYVGGRNDGEPAPGCKASSVVPTSTHRGRSEEEVKVEVESSGEEWCVA